MLIYILDLVGVFAFAFLGVRNAVERKFNAWGIVVCAFLPALGGGTIRSLVLNKVPIYFLDHTYVYVVLASALLSVISYDVFARLRKCMMVLDAVGMVAFSYIGAHAAAAAHLGLFGMVVFAALSALGGGVLCDIVANKTPHIFNQGIWYGLPPVAVGISCWFLGGKLQQPSVRDGLLASAIVVQLNVTLSLSGILRSFHSRKQFAVLNRLIPVSLRVLLSDEDR